MADKRMVLTPEQEKSLRLFVALAESEGWSQSDAARRWECSESTYKQILAGTYPGNYARYIERAERHVNLAKRRSRAIQDPPFALTSVSERVDALCTLCLDGKRMGHVVARSGAGKTMAVRAYAAAHALDTILITCTPGYSGVDLLRELADNLQRSWRFGKTLMFRDIATHLELRGQPLIILDDCDNLTRNGLHTARQLHDEAQCGIVLAGTEEFLRGLARRQTGLDGQALGRLLHVVHIDGICEEDAERILCPFGLPSAAVQMAWQACAGDARRLVHGVIEGLTIARAEGLEADERAIRRGFGALLAHKLGA